MENGELFVKNGFVIKNNLFNFGKYFILSVL